MAEEPKKKIDLKARLKKDAGTPAPPPTSSGGVAGVPAPASSAPVPGMSGPGIPVPPGVAIGGPAHTDASNPLAIAAGMAREAHPQAHQRIEVDETEVRAASSKARRTGLVIGLFIAVLAGAGGVMVGNAQEVSNGRKKAHNDAVELKGNVEKAQTKLESIATALEDAQKQLQAKPGERKFPSDLANTLGGLHVDFDGTQLAGRRFSGFSTDTTTNLVDFITGVAAMEDDKTALKNLITRISSNKAFVEQFNAATVGKNVEYMVLLGGPTGRDPKGNYSAMISKLTAPIAITPDKIDIPKDLQGTNPLSPNGSNVSGSVYQNGTLDKPVAMYINPASWDLACPPETKSLAGQLGIKLGDLVTKLRGQPAQEGLVEDVKPGLIDRAKTLQKALEKI
jgi:hypothetical protein